LSPDGVADGTPGTAAVPATGTTTAPPGGVTVAADVAGATVTAAPGTTGTPAATVAPAGTTGTAGAAGAEGTAGAAGAVADTLAWAVGAGTETDAFGTDCAKADPDTLAFTARVAARATAARARNIAP